MNDPKEYKPSWFAVLASICVMTLVGALWFQIAPMLSAANGALRGPAQPAEQPVARGDPSLPDTATVVPEASTPEAPVPTF